MTIIICSFLVNSVAFASTNKNKGRQTFSQVFAFGDSYSDNGEAKRISTAIVEAPNAPSNAYIKPSDELYWNNRYSNGYTAVEVLAQMMEVPLTNYATGGARSGQENYSAWMDFLGTTGVLGQIDTFEASLNGGQADPDALYFIFGSANDYFYFMDYGLEGDIKDVADEAVENTKLAVAKLAKLGAKKILVVNSSDLTLVPYEVVNNRTDSAEAFVKRFNKKLPKAMKKAKKELGISIRVFDVTKVSKKIVKKPHKYGIEYISKECQSTYPEVKPVNENPDSYYFWDEWHFSRAVHGFIGEAMYKSIKKFR